MSNVFSIKSFDKCVGCTACEAMCPKHAIKITKDQLGFLRPKLIGDCIDCGICAKVCTMFSKSASANTRTLKCFSASTCDKDILYKSSSGGLSYHLMDVLIQRGYDVIGCLYDLKSNEAIHSVAHNKKEIEGFFGSKYFQSDFRSAIQYLIQNRNRKVAIFGLPCQIKSINLVANYLKLNRDNLFLVSVMCFGVASPILWKKYLNEIVNKKIKEEITDIKFRSKYYGWHRSTIEFRTHNRTFISNPLENEFLELYYSRSYFNESCYTCITRKEFSNEDLRIGDFWGDLFQNNNNGKSGIIICTPRGEAIFDLIKPLIDFKEERLASFLENQSLENVKNGNTEDRERLRASLIELGIKKSVRLYKKTHFNFKDRLFKTLWVLKRKIVNKERRFKKVKYE